MSLEAGSIQQLRKVHSTSQMSGGSYRKKILSINLTIQKSKGLQQKELSTILKTLVEHSCISDTGVQRIFLRSYVFSYLNFNV